MCVYITTQIYNPKTIIFGNYKKNFFYLQCWLTSLIYYCKQINLMIILYLDFIIYL